MNEIHKTEAKNLFFRYEGSRFYMSRNGVEETYERLEVPPELEASWLLELTEERLRHLDAPGNWQVVHFLTHHCDVSNLPAILTARPQGKMWERCAYIEQLLTLLKMADIYQTISISDAKEALSVNDRQEALEIAKQRALELREDAREEESRQRVESIIQEADSLIERLATSGSLDASSPGWWPRLMAWIRKRSK